VLGSWRDDEAKEAILRSVNRVCDESSGGAVPVDDRVTVFDNDGTLWCEKPMPIHLDFVLRRLAVMAQAEESRRDRQPWKWAYEHDYGWFAAAVVDHYAGDDTKAGSLPAVSWQGSENSALSSSRSSRRNSCVKSGIPPWIVATWNVPTYP
jgi:hypothetical protein